MYNVVMAVTGMDDKLRISFYNNSVVCSLVMTTMMVVICYEIFDILIILDFLRDFGQSQSNNFYSCK